VKPTRTRIDALGEQLVESMRREFPAALESTNRAGLPRFTIPPLVREFGPLLAEVDLVDGPTLVVGQLTHTHFDGGSAVEELIAMCRNILADEIVIASFVGGASMSPREFVDFTENAEFWVWSGRVSAEELLSRVSRRS
jgi:hypothetical protein